jgi:hypothetical protein
MWRGVWKASYPCSYPYLVHPKAGQILHCSHLEQVGSTPSHFPLEWVDPYPLIFPNIG